MIIEAYEGRFGEEGCRRAWPAKRFSSTPAVTGVFVVSAANEKYVRVYGLVRPFFLGFHLNSSQGTDSFGSCRFPILDIALN